MKSRAYNIFLTIIGLLIVVLVIFTIYVATHRASELEGIIIYKEDITYEDEVLRTYDEYSAFLNKYSALGKLNEKDFIKYDYLIDYIPYVEDMTIKSINVVINDNYINITYDVNKKIDNDTAKLLISFIPIEKNNIDELPEINQIFK